MDNQDKDTRQPFELDEAPQPDAASGRRARPSGMNKRLSVIMLLVLFVVMALLVFSQFGGEKQEQTAEPDTGQSQQQTEAGGQMPQPPAGEVPEDAPSVHGEMPAEAEGVPSEGDEQAAANATAPSGSTLESASTAPAGEDAPAVPQKPQKPAEEPAAQQAAKPEAKKPAATPAAPPAPKPTPRKQAETAKAEQPAPKAAKAEPSPKKPVGPRNQLKNIRVKVEHTAVVLDIIAQRAVEHYKFFGLENPQRKVVDLLGPFKPHAPQMKVPENNYVSGLRIGDHPDKLRIVADIKTEDKLKMQVERVSEKQIRLTITR